MNDATVSESILALQHKSPLREMEIAGKVYPMGDLSAEQIEAYTAMGERVAAGKATKADQNPRHSVFMLLWAADKSLDLRPIYDSIEPHHVLAAGEEVMRQILVRALSGYAGTA